MLSSSVISGYTSNRHSAEVEMLGNKLLSQNLEDVDLIFITGNQQCITIVKNQ
jgi:hypothetical protein